MTNRFTAYRKLLKSLYSELEELEIKFERTERRRASYRKLDEIEDDIESCEDDIDVVEGLLKQLLRRKKPAPRKKTTRPFQVPSQVRKPIARKISEPEYEEEFEDDEEEEEDEDLNDPNFPELDEYIDEDIFEMDDEDFYVGDTK